jgi:hypothetical protein
MDRTVFESDQGFRDIGESRRRNLGIDEDSCKE